MKISCTTASIASAGTPIRRAELQTNPKWSSYTASKDGVVASDAPFAAVVAPRTGDPTGGHCVPWGLAMGRGRRQAVRAGAPRSIGRDGDGQALDIEVRGLDAGGHDGGLRHAGIGTIVGHGIRAVLVLGHV